MLNTKTSLFSLYVVVDQLQRVTQIERFVSFFLWVWKPNKSLRTQETVPDRCPLTCSGGPFWTPVVDSNSHESSMFIGWPVFSGYLASTDRTLRLISKERITSRPTHFFLSFFGFETKKINPNKCLRMQEMSWTVANLLIVVGLLVGLLGPMWFVGFQDSKKARKKVLQ